MFEPSEWSNPDFWRFWVGFQCLQSLPPGSGCGSKNSDPSTVPKLTVLVRFLIEQELCFLICAVAGYATVQIVQFEEFKMESTCRAGLLQFA